MLTGREKARLRRRAMREHVGALVRAAAVAIGVCAVLTAIVSFAGVSDSGWSGAIYTAVAVAPVAFALGWFNRRYVEPEIDQAEKAAASGSM